MIGVFTCADFEITPEELLARASRARANSYSPYSRYAVGAALLASDGRVFCGCNIENASYSATVCAERAAFFAAVSAGVREFVAIAVAGGPVGEDCRVCTPCGICRQVMAEFCTSDLCVVLLGEDGGATVRRLGELLPDSFGAAQMREGGQGV